MRYFQINGLVEKDRRAASPSLMPFIIATLFSLEISQSKLYCNKIPENWKGIIQREICLTPPMVVNNIQQAHFERAAH